MDKLPILGAVGLIAVTTALYFIFGKKSSSKGEITLKDPNIKYALKLVEKTDLSHDTRLYRFALPSENHVLGLPTGQHIYLSATVNGSLVVRPYTPTSSDDDFGHVDLVVKVYFKNIHPKFPEGGKMTQYLNDLPLGATIDFRGPSGLLVYKSNGEFAIRPDKKSPPNSVRATKINMVAGGSGITPMYQIIKHVFKESNSNVSLSLIYANQTEDDILIREELEKYAKEHPDRFKLWYTVDRPPADWKYSSGFISEDMLRDNFFPPSNDTIVLMCGPPPMINFACIPNLDKLGYDAKMRFAY